MRVVEPTPEAIKAAQQPDRCYHVKEGLSELLHDAIGSQDGLYCAALCGRVDHYQYGQDHAWGCGWRNIQMVASNLTQHKDFVGKLFGGVDYVPDIPSLQAWLECAWHLGYDTAGAEQLGQHIQGSHTWIGTTEAATLLRQFGVRARVVDFIGGRRGRKDRKRSHRGPSAPGGSPDNLRGASEHDVNEEDEADEAAAKRSRDRARRGGWVAKQHGALEEDESCEEEEEEEDDARGWRDEADASPRGAAFAPAPPKMWTSGGRLLSRDMDAGAEQGSSATGQGIKADMERETGPAGQQPMHSGVCCDMCGRMPIRGTRFQSKWSTNYDLCEACHSKPEAGRSAPYAAVKITTEREARLVDHRQLMQWVWNYFTDELSSGAEPPTEAHDHAWRENVEDDPVILSGKPPLYFQHQGHSRTLIGVERIQLHPGHAAEVSLLLLDPGQSTEALAQALRDKRGWQDMVKRNLCMLKMAEYQLMYVISGSASGNELEELKKMHAVQKFSS